MDVHISHQGTRLLKQQRRPRRCRRRGVWLECCAVSRLLPFPQRTTCECRTRPRLCVSELTQTRPTPTQFECMAVRMALAAAAHHSSQRVSSASTQTENVAPTPSSSCAAPAPVTYRGTCTCRLQCNASDCEHICGACTIAPPSAATRLTFSLDTTGFVNPQFSVLAVEASASQVVGSLPSVDESASPVYNQVHQEQIAAEQECGVCATAHC